MDQRFNFPWLPAVTFSTGRLPLSVDAIHGDRSQRDREAALQHFRSGATQVPPADGAVVQPATAWTSEKYENYETYENY